MTIDLLKPKVEVAPPPPPPPAEPPSLFDIDSLLKRLFPRQRDSETTLQWIEAEPLNFLRSLKQKGRTPRAEQLLKLVYPDAADEDIDEVWPGVPKVSPYVSERITAPMAWPKMPTGEGIVAVMGYSKDGMWVHKDYATPEQKQTWQPTRADEIPRDPTFLGLTKTQRETKDIGLGIAGFQERLRSDPNLLIRLANTPIPGIGLTATEIDAFALIGYGTYQAATVGWNAFLRLSLNRNLNSWTKSANVEIPKETKNIFINKAMAELDKKWLSLQAIKTIFKPTKAGLQVSPGVARQADAEATNILQRLVPRATQTGAMAFGGLPTKPLPSVTWGAMTVPERVALAQSQGLAGTVGSKAWEALTAEERQVLSSAILVPEKVVPIAPEVEKIPREFELTETERKVMKPLTRQIWQKLTSFEKSEAFRVRVIVPTRGQREIWETISDAHKLELQRAAEILIPAIPKAVVTPEVRPLPVTMVEMLDNPAVAQKTVEIMRNRLQILADRGFNIEGITQDYIGDLIKQGIEERFARSLVNMASEKVKIPAIPKAEPGMPEVPAPTYPATPAGAEARAKVEGISISEASRLNAEEALKAPAVAEVPPTPPPDRPISPADTLPPAPTPPPIQPTWLGENVIGLRTIQPGLIRSETIGNIFKRAISKLGVQVVEADPLANAAMNERARVHTAIESNAHILGTKAEAILLKVFTFDKKGRIPSLVGIDTTIKGTPTIQDVAARLPTYREKLTQPQLDALAEIKEMVQPYHQLLEEVGVEIPTRQDVMSGGFYLPRGRAALEGADEPIKIGVGRKGMRKGFERPALFESQAEGINKGFEYAPIGDALTAYGFDAGVRAIDAHVVNYFKALTDDAGNLLGETVKIRLMRQNPEIAKVVEEINGNLTKLRRNIGALTQRQMDVIDLWQNDPEFNDIDILLDGLETMRAGIPAQTLPELKALFEQNKEALKVLRPGYKKALRRAQATPRDQGVIILPALAGRTFPVELSNAANQYLMKEGRTIGKLAPVVNVANAINNLYRGVTATLDNSAMGIQGLLGMYSQPAAYYEALKVNIRAWGIGGDKVLGKFLVEFDAQAIKNGRLTSSDWARVGSHLGGATHEFQLGRGPGSRIGNLPVVRQANRAFGYLGDALRLEWEDSELQGQMAKRSLNQIRESGDLERIANAANVMTGWHTKQFAGSLGDLTLYAARFFQSRISTVVKAGASLRPNATLDQRMARMSLLKMIGFGTILTILANMLAGEDDTDFRPIVDGKRNPKFMRIKFKGHYYSLFGTWDSLFAMFLHIGTGKPLQAIRGMSSGVVKGAWDIITGRDYTYKAITDTPLHFAQWIGDSLVPFAIGDVPRGVRQFAGGIVEGDIGEAVGGITQIFAELLGYKVFPEKDWKENRLKLGLPISDDPALYSTENPIYTFGKYASDTLNKLGEIRPSEVIGNKSYPADVQAIVQAREYQRELANYPNRKLSSINADSTKGDTFVEFYQQWNRQQELVAAGDKAKYTDKAGVKHAGEDAVKAFKNDYKQSEQGNMTQRQYVLLTQYNQITDPKRKEAFLKANPELSINPHNEWLKEHPKENAYLAICGWAKLYSEEAFNQAMDMVFKFDIPDSAVSEYLLPLDLVKSYFALPESRRSDILKPGTTKAIAQMYVEYAKIYDSEERGAETKAKAYRKSHPELQAWGEKNLGWQPLIKKREELSEQERLRGLGELLK